MCHVVCAHGYRLDSPSNRTCRKDNTGSLVWSDGPQCVGECTLTRQTLSLIFARSCCRLQLHAM